MTTLRKNAVWALIFLCVIAVSALFLMRGMFLPSKAKTARVMQDGNVIRVIDLQKAHEPYEFDVLSPDGGQNTVRVERGKIGVVSADCPDQICVRQGLIDNSVLPVVCLPHKLSIVIADDEAEVDAVAGGDGG